MTDVHADRRFTAGRALALGFGGTAVLFAGVLVWSVFASFSSAVIATGVVTVETRNQVVEHIDGGTVSEILVRDGDLVAKDGVLLRFADGPLRSEEAILASRYVELAARRNRLEAEIRGADAIAWDLELAALAAEDSSVADILTGQERLFGARAAARSGEIARLRERIGQARDEIAGLEAQAVSLEEQIALIGRELAAQESLFGQGSSRLLALQRAAKDLEGQSGTTTAQIARVLGSIAELETQILQVDKRQNEDAEQQARETSATENEVRERLASVRERLDRLEVRAPVAGEVFGMTVFAPREVVRPGEPMLQIVPRDKDLVVTARIEPTDVDQTYPGQPVLLRFPAFPARETPEFDGRVARVSADTMHDGASGLSWYEIELVVDRPDLDDAERDTQDAPGEASRRLGGFEIAPGMPVEAHIRTGERTVLSYLVKPITDFFHRSLREE